MTCHEFTRAVDAYLDDELPVMEILRMHRHMFSCDACRRVMGAEAAFHAVLRQEAAGENPPASLRERILERAAVEDPPRAPRSGWGRFASFRAVLAGAGIIGLLLVAPLIPGSRGPVDLVPLAAELAAKHLLYSGGQGAGLEMSSADNSEMTKWLKRRLGLSGSLPRLQREDERLLGGRLSSIADVPAAYLLYERGGRPVSLFITRLLRGVGRGMPQGVVEGVELNGAALHGVVVVWWEDEEEGRLYAAVSTGGAGELQDFASLCIRSDHAAKPERRPT